MKQISFLKLSIVAASLCIGSSVQAQSLVIQPVSATATATGGGGWSAGQLVDGSGLSDSSTVNTGDPVPGSWPTHTPSVSSNAWRAESTSLPVSLTFDLGSEVENVSGIHYWNYTEFFDDAYLTGRGVNEAEIWVSLNNVTYTQVGSSPFNFEEAAQSNTEPGADLSFASPVTGRYFRFDIQSNHGGEFGNFVGMNEVRFVQVPEPNSLALAFLGSVGLIALRRRR